jgi:hypothetical protein
MGQVGTSCGLPTSPKLTHSEATISGKIGVGTGHERETGGPDQNPVRFGSDNVGWTGTERDGTRCLIEDRPAARDKNPVRSGSDSLGGTGTGHVVQWRMVKQIGPHPGPT